MTEFYDLATQRAIWQAQAQEMAHRTKRCRVCDCTLTTTNQSEADRKWKQHICQPCHRAYWRQTWWKLRAKRAERVLDQMRQLLNTG